MGQPFIMDFGKWKGTPITRVDLSYLKWMVNVNPPHRHRKLALDEINRRGSAIEETVVISDHAVDRLSLRGIGIWDRCREENEGIVSWLKRICGQALTECEKIPGNEEGTFKIHFLSLELVFKEGVIAPTLVSLWVNKGDGKKEES